MNDRREHVPGGTPNLEDSDRPSEDESLVHHPVFVVGMGRSGTTALQMSLGQHPLVVASKKESPFISRIGGLFHGYFAPGARFRGYCIDSLEIPVAQVYHTFRTLCYESAIGPTQEPTKTRWCAKTFPTSDEAQGLIELFPNVKFLYILRNGCDVVRSQMTFPHVSGQEFRTYCEGWTHHVSKYAYLSKHTHAIEVRHEEIVAAPEQALRNILNFIGVAEHPSCVEFMKTVHVHPLDQPTQGGVDVNKVMGLRPPAYSTWSAEQRDTFKGVCGEAMCACGYQIPF